MRIDSWGPPTVLALLLSLMGCFGYGSGSYNPSIPNPPTIREHREREHHERREHHENRHDHEKEHHEHDHDHS